jgi:ketosteroid isomerase-like protein
VKVPVGGAAKEHPVPTKSETGTTDDDTLLREADVQRTADEADLRQLVADRTAAMRTGDAQSICGLYAAGAVVFSLAPPLVQPAESAADVSQLQAWFDEKGGSVWSEVRDLSVTVSGDLALCTSLDSMGTPPDSRQQFTLWYRSTLALARTGGAWLIIHEHTSTPFYMDDSARAATDLQP